MLEQVRDQETAEVDVSAPAVEPVEVRTGWPCFEPDEVGAAVAVLRSGRVNYWTGEEGRDFEREFAAASARATRSRWRTAPSRSKRRCTRSASATGDEVVVTAAQLHRLGELRRRCGCTARLRRRGSGLAEHHRRHDRAATLTERTRAIIASTSPAGRATWTRSWSWRARATIEVIEDCAQAHGALLQGPARWARSATSPRGRSARTRS